MKKIIDYLTKFEKKRDWDHYNRARTKEEKIELLYKKIVTFLEEFGEFTNLSLSTNAFVQQQLSGIFA